MNRELLAFLEQKLLYKRRHSLYKQDIFIQHLK
jgi:hypothetical protein